MNCFDFDAIEMLKVKMQHTHLMGMLLHEIR
jgi:hypothetical protein